MEKWTFGSNKIEKKSFQSFFAFSRFRDRNGGELGTIVELWMWQYYDTVATIKWDCGHERMYCTISSAFFAIEESFVCQWRLCNWVCQGLYGVETPAKELPFVDRHSGRFTGIKQIKYEKKINEKIKIKNKNKIVIKMTNTSDAGKMESKLDVSSSRLLWAIKQNN